MREHFQQKVQIEVKFLTKSQNIICLLNNNVDTKKTTKNFSTLLLAFGWQKFYKIISYGMKKRRRMKSMEIIHVQRQRNF